MTETETTFTIGVTYLLEDSKDAYVDVAFNDIEGIDSYYVRESVSASSGTHTITIEAVSTPLDRSDGEDYGVLVVLSEKSTDWDVIDSQLTTLAQASAP